ncbi:ATP-binding protein [Roseovarius autotrophicus]|uniref:hybrid sensor histidine kinase/response regulator n=1 Tax=Roseovarius autotrophicus TaxID=2824121 RepID=UPI00300D6950
MAFPESPAQDWQTRGSQSGRRGLALVVAAVVLALTALLLGDRTLAQPVALSAVVILLGALWLRIGRAVAQRRARSVRADVIRLFEDDPGAVLLSVAGGCLIFANHSARRLFGNNGQGTLATLLKEHLANPGALLFRMESRAEAVGSSVEDIVTRDGHMRIVLHRAGEGQFVWRFEVPAARATQASDQHPLPMLTLGRNNTVLYMNPAARELVGARVPSLEALGLTAPQSGSLCEISTAAGQVPCIFVELSGIAGRREIYLLPGARNPVTMPDSWALFDDLPVPLLKLARDGTVLRANPPARALLDHASPDPVLLSELLEGLGRPVSDWVADAAAERGSLKPEFLRLRGNDRDAFVQVALGRARDSGEIVLIAVLSDATELKSLQAQFVQSQKMQAIGQLAGGIAHDFNNLLTAIAGHCDLLLMHRDPGDPEYSDLMQINQNVNRAASLVGQLLAFSRKQTLCPTLLDLRDTLADLTHLLNRLVGEQVSLTLDHEPGLWAIRADKRQIEQVIMNLVVNARDAMPGGGEIRIVTRNRVLDAPLQRDRAVVASGRYVTVEVSDTGHGIAPDMIAKVFEPFFTTKRVGEGTGLGLSTAYGIVKQTGGFIFADSTENEGTTFQLLFPAHDHACVVEPVPEPLTLAAAVSVGVVLLVEDELPVRAFASRALQLRGFTVLEAGSAEEALELLTDQACHVDVFVTDVVMPGMDGPNWVQKALALRPEVRVVFMSGYAEETFGDIQARIDKSVFLPKPFSLNDLAETVQRMMTMKVT